MASAINPIIPGFAPDPSIILHEGKYFLVNSSFHIWPGLPIYVSDDLVSWRHIGNALNRSEQMSVTLSTTNIIPLPHKNDTLFSTGGLYAPTLRYHDGTFYIVCTNCIHDEQGVRTQNFILTTKDIWKCQWSNPVYFEFAGIDPDIVWDDEGRSFIQGSGEKGPKTKIQQFEIDLETGKQLSSKTTLWGGITQHWPEGPHIFKRNKWYYLIIAEGGSHKGHMIEIARSDNIQGPYEVYSGNPILPPTKDDDYIQYNGHGDIFQDKEGAWWCVCLGVRRTNAGNFILSRETFITTVSWTEDEWPIIQPIQLDPEPLLRAAEARSLPTAEPQVDLVYIRDPDSQMYKISNDIKTFTLTASRFDASQSKEPVTFIGKRQRALTGYSSASIDQIGGSYGDKIKAGLMHYKDEHRFAQIYVDFDKLTVNFEFANPAKSTDRKVSKDFSTGRSISLKISYTEETLEFAYQSDSLGWITLASMNTLDMSGLDFVGPLVGLFATTSSSAKDVTFKKVTFN